jgi:hypothetical protein
VTDPKTAALPLGYTPENVRYTGEEGIEPPLLGLESRVLPLHHPPKAAMEAGEEGIEPPSLSLKPRILAAVLFPRKVR